MEFCILGLLLLKPQSIYQLKLAFQNSLSLFYQASLGAIHTTIKKLLAKNLIEVQTQLTRGRKTIFYKVTSQGESYFFHQFFVPLPKGKFEQTILARVFFLGLVKSQELRIKVLDVLRSAVNQELNKLKDVQKTLNQINVTPDFATIFDYQQSTLVYGIAAHQLALDWLSKLLQIKEDSNGTP